MKWAKRLKYFSKNTQRANQYMKTLKITDQKNANKNRKDITTKPQKIRNAEKYMEKLEPLCSAKMNAFKQA